jgi:hypothetical protein
MITHFSCKNPGPRVVLEAEISKSEWGRNERTLMSQSLVLTAAAIEKENGANKARKSADCGRLHPQKPSQLVRHSDTYRERIIT